MTKVTAVKCPCGDKGCSTWQLSIGTWFRGSGFEKSEAEEIAQAINYARNNPSLPDGAWAVKIETRKKNAIGVFAPTFYTVRAAGREQASRFAIDNTDLDGLEPGVVLEAEFQGPWINYVRERNS